MNSASTPRVRWAQRLGRRLPGPIRAVGDALRDLPGVAARYAAARKKFNERFNRRHDGYATKRVVDAFFA